MAYNTQPTTTGKKDPMKTKAETAGVAAAGRAAAAARVTKIDESAKPKPSPQKKEGAKKGPKGKIDWKNTAKPPKTSRDHVDKLVPKKRTIQDKKSTRKTSDYRPDAPVKRETMTRTVTKKTGPSVRKPVRKPTGGKKRVQQQERDEMGYQI